MIYKRISSKGNPNLFFPVSDQSTPNNNNSNTLQKLLPSINIKRNLNPDNHPIPIPKMHFSTLPLLSLLSLASARIIGIAVPKTIRPGDGFNAIIETENYIQSVYDVSIAFGIASGPGYPGSLGTVIGSYYLGPGTYIPTPPSLSSPIIHPCILIFLKNNNKLTRTDRTIKYSNQHNKMDK